MKRWNIDAPANDQYEEHPEGQWVRFEDHEQALARYKGAVEDWARKWGRTHETNQALLARLEAAKAAHDELRRRAQALVDACSGRGDGRPHPPLMALEALLEETKP